MKQNLDVISVLTLPRFPKDPFIAKAEIQWWLFATSAGTNPYPNPGILARSFRASTKGSPCVSHWFCQLEPMDNFWAHIYSSRKQLPGVTAALCWWGVIPEQSTCWGTNSYLTSDRLGSEYAFLSAASARMTPDFADNRFIPHGKLWVWASDFSSFISQTGLSL